MRRLPLTLALVAAVAAIAACAAPAAPGWTYAPAPSVTPAPSGSAGASGSPAASASAAASPSAAASSSAAASGSPAASGGGTGLTITAPSGAAATGFDPSTLEAAANTAFTVTFDNQDAGVPHNWVLQNPDGSKVDIGDTTFFNGVAQKTYNVPALAAGTYSFMCEVHPQTMKGTLTAK